MLKLCKRRHPCFLFSNVSQKRLTQSDLAAESVTCTQLFIHIVWNWKRFNDILFICSTEPTPKYDGHSESTKHYNRHKRSQTCLTKTTVYIGIKHASYYACNDNDNNSYYFLNYYILLKRVLTDGGVWSDTIFASFVGGLS